MPQHTISLRSQDLALLFDGNLAELSDEAAAALREMASQDPYIEAELARLRRMAADARTDWLEDALTTHRQLERLISQGDWESPLEILGDEIQAVPYHLLIPMARAHAAASDDPGRLLRVTSLLIQAAAFDELHKGYSETFIEQLKKLDSEVAEAMLERLFAELRHLHRKQPEKDPPPQEETTATSPETARSHSSR